MTLKHIPKHALLSVKLWYLIKCVSFVLLKGEKNGFDNSLLTDSMRSLSLTLKLDYMYLVNTNKELVT